MNGHKYYRREEPIQKYAQSALNFSLIAQNATRRNVSNIKMIMAKKKLIQIKMMIQVIMMMIKFLKHVVKRFKVALNAVQISKNV